MIDGWLSAVREVAALQKESNEFLWFPGALITLLSWHKLFSDQITVRVSGVWWMLSVGDGKCLEIKPLRYFKNDQSCSCGL